MHHLDLIDHYLFQFFQTFIRKCLKLYNKNLEQVKNGNLKFLNFNVNKKNYFNLIFNNKVYNLNLRGNK